MIFLASSYELYYFGSQIEIVESIGESDFFRRPIKENFLGIKNVANSIETGFNGAALGFGLISSICLIGIVWINISRLKLNK